MPEIVPEEGQGNIQGKTDIKQQASAHLSKANQLPPHTRHITLTKNQKVYSVRTPGRTASPADASITAP